MPVVQADASAKVGWRARRLLRKLADWIEANEPPMRFDKDTLELRFSEDGILRLWGDTTACIAGTLVLMDISERRPMPDYLDDELYSETVRSLASNPYGPSRTYRGSTVIGYARERLRLSADAAWMLFSPFPPGCDGIFGPVPTAETHRETREWAVRQLHHIVKHRKIDWAATPRQAG